MTLFRNAGPGIGGGVLPDDFGPLVEQPVARDSIAYLVSTLFQTDRARVHIPIVTADASAAWTAEGADITQTEPTLAEVLATPSKLAALTAITNEMVSDSDPKALEIVGAGLARDIAKKVDTAFFGNTTTNGPSGLLSVSGVGTVVPTPPVANADPFAQAVSQAELVGATITAWVVNPADALALATIKEATGSQRGLLQPDPTAAGRRVIENVPMLVSPAVAAGVAWGIPGDRVYVVQRGGATLETDESFYFGSDKTALRATMRVAFAFPHPAAIQKITLNFVAP